MANHYQKLLMQVAELRRQLGSMVMMGSVHEVKGDRVRMNMGKDKDGKDVIGPWTHTGNQRGGAREGRFYKKGQNVTMLNPGGDPSQGILMPYGPNKDFKRPDHASSKGQDEETYQQEDFRKKRTKEGDDTWLEPPEKEDQQQQQGQDGGGGSQDGDWDQQKEQEKEGTTGGDKALMKRRMNKDSGHTMRVGKGDSAARAHVHKDGATVSYGKDNHAFVDKDLAMLSMPGGQVWVDKDGIWSSKPIQVKSPPKTKPGWDFDDK